jgi:hypothetical protein
MVRRRGHLWSVPFRRGDDCGEDCEGEDRGLSLILRRAVGREMGTPISSGDRPVSGREARVGSARSPSGTGCGWRDTS